MEGITLEQLIKELQALEAEHGDKKILSIGTIPGTFGGMTSPFVINLVQTQTDQVDSMNIRAVIPSLEEDIGKSYVK